MGKAIVEALVPIVLALIAAWVIIYFRRKQSKEKALDKGWAIKGDLNSRQEKALITEVNTAAVLFRQLLAPPPDWASDMTYLRVEDRKAVENWLRQHNTSSGSNMRKDYEQA